MAMGQSAYGTRDPGVETLKRGEPFLFFIKLSHYRYREGLDFLYTPFTLVATSFPVQFPPRWKHYWSCVR